MAVASTSRRAGLAIAGSCALLAGLLAGVPAAAQDAQSRDHLRHLG